MKSVALLLLTIAISATSASQQERGASGRRGSYSYYVSSNWPSGPSDSKSGDYPDTKPIRQQKHSSHKEENRGEKDDDDGRYGYGFGYGPGEVLPKVTGRHGLGFEKRIAAATGLRQPVTPESLEHIGKRRLVSEVKYVPLQ